MPRRGTVKKAPDLQTLDDALIAFQRATGLHAEKRQAGFLAGKQPVDAVIRLNEPTGPVEYLAEIRKAVTEPMLGQLMQKFIANPGKWIVIALRPGISCEKDERARPAVHGYRRQCVRPRILLLIFIHGNRTRGPVRERGADVAFNTGAIRILFVLLCEPRLLNPPIANLQLQPARHSAQWPA